MSFKNIQDAIERSKTKKESLFFKSRFKHLMIHNGHRRGELITFVGEKGGGKSSLIRAWILELILQHKKVYLRLSEEYSRDYRDEILRFFNEETAFFQKYLIIDSELELQQSELGSEYIEMLDLRIKASEADVFIFDNFTTSVLSSRSPAQQQLSAVALRNIAGINNIPVIVAAHTEKSFKKHTIATGDNIRGNATLVNTAAYIYTLTIWHDKPNRPAVLYIDKARHHAKANKKCFLLCYDLEAETYKNDKELTFELLKEILAK